MGLVYKASEVELGRHVALKLIRPEYASQEPFRRRFLRESRLAASLDHPNVIPIYAAGEAHGLLYLAMRYVEGSDLGTLLRQRRTLPARDALVVVAQLAGALDAAHARGLVHRDVKPSNVLLDTHGHVYLSDFGLSKRLAAAEATNTGQFAGTLDYLAPEQIRGEPLDGRADQYALACLLFECLTGVPPFRRDTEAETLWAHMQEPPPPLLVGHHDIQPALTRALSKDPNQRHRSCVDFAATAGAAPPADAAVLRSRPEPRSRRLARRLSRRRAPATVGLLVAGAAIAVALVLALRAGGLQFAADSAGAVDPITDQLVTDVRLGKTPSDIAVGGGRIWILSQDGRTVWAFAPATPGAVARISLHVRAISQWAGGGNPIGANDFIVGTHANTLTVVSQARGPNAGVDLPALAPIKVWAATSDGRACSSYVTGSNDTVWVSQGRRLAEIDALTGLVLETRVLGAAGKAATHTCYGVSYTGARLLASRSPGASIGYVDPTRGGFAPIVTSVAGITAQVGGDQIAAWAVGFRALWIVANGALARVDLRTRTVTHVLAGVAAHALVVDPASGVWVLVDRGRTLARVNPATLGVSRRMALQRPARGIALGYGRLWLVFGSA